MSMAITVSVASWDGKLHHSYTGSIDSCLEFIEEYGESGTSIVMSIEASNEDVLLTLRRLAGEGGDGD